MNRHLATLYKHPCHSLSGPSTRRATVGVAGLHRRNRTHVTDDSSHRHNSPRCMRTETREVHPPDIGHTHDQFQRGDKARFQKSLHPNHTGDGQTEKQRVSAPASLLGPLAPSGPMSAQCALRITHNKHGVRRNTTYKNKHANRYRS